MLPVPPLATIVGDAVKVIWHLADVGPVAREEVDVEEPQLAAAMAAAIRTAGRPDRRTQTEGWNSESCRDKCLGCIEALRRLFRLVHTMRHQRSRYDSAWSVVQ